MSCKVSSSIGIDISKSCLDVHHSPSGEYKRHTNDAKGITALIGSLPPDVRNIVLEPSGGYERTVLMALQQAGFPVSLVNARQIRDYARARGILAKTDKLDAAVLADYGATIHPAPSMRITPQALRLKALVRRREQIVGFIRQESSAFDRHTDSDVRQMAQDHIARLEQDKAQLEALIEAEIQSARALKRKAEILQSCKGIGPVSIATLLADMPELGCIEGRKAAALAGLAPHNRDSGSWRGKRTTFGGRKNLKRTLFMAALSASRSNPDIKAFYQKKKSEGKSSKQAIIACARKLLLTLNALIRDNRIWTP